MSRICFLRNMIFLLIIQIFSPLLLFAGEEIKGSKKEGREVRFEITQAAGKEGVMRPVLTIHPREINLGEIGPGDVANGLYSLRNIGSGSLQWSLDGLESWHPGGDEELTGVLAADPDYLRLSVKSLRTDNLQIAEKARQRYHNIQLTIEAGGKKLILRKDLPAGAYQEALKITSLGGIRTVFLNFKVTDVKSAPPLDVEPAKIDFGILTPGKQVTKQIRITNKGRESVKWRLLIPRQGEERISELSFKGRDVSFLNNEIKGRGAGYVPAAHLRDNMELIGQWQEHEGHPTSFGTGNFLKYHFAGTGIGLNFWHVPEGGQFAAYIDDKLIHVYDSTAPERGREMLPIVDGLSDGPHVLTIANGEGRIIIEGVSVYGREWMKGNPGWITVIPDSGTTSRETDYANVRIDTQQMNPGLYGGQIVLVSNRGEIILEAFVEIKPDQAPRFLDVYRYVRNHNYLFTTNPQAEAGRINKGKYRKEGIAFRLFAPGVPGTTEFYRWYNMKKDDHYYSYSMNGHGRSLKEYVLEGSIGNIGTSKLTNTRELYRWYNPKTESHFFTTDEKGEGISRKGYKFDGIAGYVK